MLMCDNSSNKKSCSVTTTLTHVMLLWCGCYELMWLTVASGVIVIVLRYDIGMRVFNSTFILRVLHSNRMRTRFTTTNHRGIR